MSGRFGAWVLRERASRTVRPVEEGDSIRARDTAVAMRDRRAETGRVARGRTLQGPLRAGGECISGEGNVRGAGASVTLAGLRRAASPHFPTKSRPWPLVRGGQGRENARRPDCFASSRCRRKANTSQDAQAYLTRCPTSLGPASRGPETVDPMDPATLVQQPWGRHPGRLQCIPYRQIRTRSREPPRNRGQISPATGIGLRDMVRRRTVVQHHEISAP